MKLAIFTTIACCVHFINCAPSITSTGLVSNDIQKLGATSASNNSGINSEEVLNIIKTLLKESLHQKASAKISAPQTPTLPNEKEAWKYNLMFLMNKAEMDLVQKKLAQTQKELEKSNKELAEIKENKSMSFSGYAVPSPQDQYVIPGEQNHIWIECVPQTNGNAGGGVGQTSAQLLSSAQTLPISSGRHAFRSYNFLNRK